AYYTYLNGRELYATYDSMLNLHAVDSFKKAIKLDPNYALAYTGLADSYALMDYFGVGKNMLDSSISFASKAQELDPYLAEAFRSVGIAQYYLGRIILAQLAFESA